MANRKSILRLSRYKNVALRLKSLNFIRVFSEDLANASGVTASQVRKDFSIFGITGNRRGGYSIDSLIEKLNKILGKEKTQHLVVVGVGNLGMALFHYRSFRTGSIQIAAGFDIDPAKLDVNVEVPILPMNDMDTFVRTRGIEMGIITVPDFAAQQVFEMMAASGIRGVINFAPIRLRNDFDVVVQSINFETEIENLSYFVNAGKKEKK